jgi:hypothetical protein
MPISHAIWTVGDKPISLKLDRLVSEKSLEDMIVEDSRILSDEWMLIGRQVRTFANRPLDLLAIAPDGSLVLIELKRGRTHRDVVAQALDYAAWVGELTSERIVDIYKRFSGGKSLDAEFQRRFKATLDEETVNQTHQIIIVAAELDDDSERIVKYLSERNVPINVLFFQVFQHGKQQLLSRAWMIDPARTQTSSTLNIKRDVEPWNGEYYVSFGASESRAWDEAVKYGFVCAGGGKWYTRTLRLLSPGDRIWVKVPWNPDEKGNGFVGVGTVVGVPQRANDFKINGNPALKMLKGGNYHRSQKDTDETEWFVPVVWKQTVLQKNAVREVGLFGNQNTVCKPTTPKWRHTVERLKEKFPKWEGK